MCLGRAILVRYRVLCRISLSPSMVIADSIIPSSIYASSRSRVRGPAVADCACFDETTGPERSDACRYQPVTGIEIVAAGHALASSIIPTYATAHCGDRYINGVSPRMYRRDLRHSAIASLLYGVCLCQGQAQ